VRELLGVDNLTPKEIKRLEAENAILRSRCTQLEEALAQPKKGPKPETSDDSHKVGTLRHRLSKAEQMLQMLLAFEHDLINTVSLAYQSLEAACADSRLVPPVIAEELHRARIAAKHSSVLVASLRDLADPSNVKGGKPGSIRKALLETREIVARNIPEGVGLSLDLAENLPPCGLPEYVLVRCALNLLTNAVQSIKKRGRVVVTATAPKRHSAKTLKVVFSDTGEGIKKRDLPKVCEPCFSTKGKQKGYGLFVVKSLLEIHGGSMEIVSKRRKGTTVVLNVPLA
jgi:signal transduction histidine kinase